MHSKEFVERMKEQLLEEKERLEEELKETTEHVDLGDDQDEEKGAQEFEIDEVNHDIAEQLKKDLKGVEEALVRIEKGSYGVCSVGGEDISEQRLEALPWTDICVEHEQA